MNVTIDKATSDTDIRAVKAIFLAFSEWLPIDLGFQDFDGEMSKFPDGFTHLLLAKNEGQPVGAVGIKEHTPETCEMKRLFVLPEAHGSGAGRALCVHLMADAKDAGYKTMLLDSLKRLEAAVALYEKLGFKEIAPFNFNPEDDVIYMSREL